MRTKWWTVWIVIIMLAIATVLGGGCQAITGKFGIEGVSDLVQETLGRIGTDESGQVTASGTIQAEEIRIASELRARIVRVHVERGAQVRAGEELVALDATPLLTELAEAEAAATVARADLAVVKTEARVEEIVAMKAALALAEAQRDGVLAAWENAQEEIENPQELDAQIAETRTRLELAEQIAILAEAELAREKLVRGQKRKYSIERDVADLQVKAAEEALAAAKVDQEAAQTLLNWLWYIRNEPLALIAEAHVAEGQSWIADAGIAVAQAQLNDLVAGPTDQEIAVAEEALRLAEAQADVLRTQKCKFALTSPVDGVVLNQALRAGEVAAAAATILTIADLSQATLIVYVPVNRIGHVWLGQQVQVTVDSFPDRTFSGRVTHVGDKPEFTPRNVATKEERLNTFYAVEISLPNADGLLKPGMPADATF